MATVGEDIKSILELGYNLNQLQVASLLKISRPKVSDLYRGATKLTPRMALMLEKVFGIEAVDMLEKQMLSDLFEAQQKYGEEVSSLEEHPMKNVVA